MSDPGKKTYKEIHGTSRVGDWLRSVDKEALLGKAVNIAGSLASGNVMGALAELLKSDSDLTPEQREYALKLIEIEMVEEQEISKRWDSDMVSDSWLSKNVRPLSLIYLTFMLTLVVILDSSMVGFMVADEWIRLLSLLLTTIYAAYFGGRILNKNTKIKKSL